MHMQHATCNTHMHMQHAHAHAAHATCSGCAVYMHMLPGLRVLGEITADEARHATHTRLQWNGA
jgi:hypothetical protein